MGVFKFFAHWVKNHKENQAALIRVYQDYTIQAPDIFLIDANSRFYDVVRKLFEKNPLSTFAEAHKAICDDLYHLIRRVNPRKTVYIAIDGVAGLCKQSQQRKRRFVAVKPITQQAEVLLLPEDEKRAEKPAFDTIHLTAGTDFMAGLCLFMRSYFSKMPYLSVNVIIDDMFLVGEGEHKLLHFIRKDQSHHTYMIYSPDADLLMLTLALNKPNMYVIRKNDLFGDLDKRDHDVEYYIVNIDRFGSIVSMKYRWSSKISPPSVFDDQFEEENSPQPPPHASASVIQPFIKSQFLLDLVLFLFIIGNDFLPNIDHVRVKEGGIDRLCEVYRSVVPFSGFLIDPNTHQFNQTSMYRMMKLLSLHESDWIVEKYRVCKNCVPDPAYVNNLEKGYLGSEDYLDLDGFRRDYYKRIHVDNVEKMCEEYFRGMSFVIQYYTKSIPTYDWYYPYFYPPLFTDLASYAKKYDLTFHFTFKPALSLHEALFSVLPPSKYYILPQELQAKMNLLSRTDPDFSETFAVDFTGKESGEHTDHEAVVLLPTVGYDKIKKLLSEFYLQPSAGVLYSIPKKLHPPVEEIRPKFYLHLFSKIRPRPGPAAGGAAVNLGPRKLFDYAKFVSYAELNEQVELITLNDALSLFIRKIGQAKRPGSHFILRSENNTLLQLLRADTIDKPDLRDLHKQARLLLRYIQQNQYIVKIEQVDRSKNIEAREVAEDAHSREQDVYISYIVKPSPAPDSSVAPTVATSRVSKKSRSKRSRETKQSEETKRKSTGIRKKKSRSRS